MTINLSSSGEEFVRSLVRRGRFTSEADVIDNALNLLREREHHVSASPDELGSMSAMRDAADELDEAAEQGLNPSRRQETVPPADESPAAVPAWQLVLDHMSDVTDEEFARMPADSSEQLDHYVYGTPKRPTTP